MLEEAIRLVFPSARTVCSAEWESYANAVYLARMEESTVEEHPVWCGDIAGLRLGFLRGLVDIFAAGLPCQPYSLAGTRDGNIDHRSWGRGDGPVPHCLRLINECRPALVWLENVSAWVRSRDQWFRPFGDELCRMGYEIAHPIFLTARGVGASHERERVFILAYSKHHARGAEWLDDAREWAQSGKADRAMPWQNGGAVADAEHAQRGRAVDQHRGIHGEREEDSEGVGVCRQGVADATLRGLGKLREPSGLEGQPPCGEPGMADTDGEHGEHGSEVRRRNAEGGRPGECGAKPSEGGPKMADTDGDGLRAGRRGRGIEGQEPQPGDQGGLVDTQGNGAGAGLREEGAERDGGGARGASAPVADTSGQGLQERGDDSGLRQLPTAERGSPFIFAPGPGSGEWGRIIAHYPNLAPAVEPGFRVLVDGLAYVVDQSRADQLRCGGNGVVAAQAAVALIQALRESILI